MAERSIEYIDIFEQDPSAPPADWIGGFDPTVDELDREPASLDDLLDDEKLDPSIRADVAAILEAET
jgi:hypothetical protein